MEGRSLKVTERSLGLLTGYLPMILQWMRNASDSTADAFLQSYRTDAAHADKAVVELLRLGGHDMTMEQLQQIGQNHSVSVWAKVVSMIMTRSSPRFVSNSIGSALIATLPELHAASSVKEVCHILGPVLDKLPRRNFEALGAFCALVRDTASSTKTVAMLVGPQILMPLISLQDDAGKSGSVMAASALMDLVILEAEALFGRVAGQRLQYPFGISRQVEQVEVMFSNFVTDTDLVKRSLRAFYDWRDIVPVDQVEKMFRLSKLESIALFVFEKYGMLPPGWPEALNRMGITDLSAIEANAKLNAKHVKEEADMVIDEVAMSEDVYNKKLHNYIEYFGKPLVDIAKGLHGEAERDALGLSEQEALEIAGGPNLIKIRDASSELIAKLDVMALIQALPLTVDGKVTQLLVAFEEMLDKFSCYIPYILGYGEATQAIDEATRRLVKEQKGRGKKKTKGRNFLQLWEIVSTSHPRLNGQSLESVLIEPIQRPPRYLLLFKELRKQMDDSHPSLSHIEGMMTKLADFNSTIDKNLLKQEKRRAKLKQLMGLEILPKDVLKDQNLG